MDDPYGNTKGKLPCFGQHLGGLALPSGAPNGGPRCTFPPALVQVLVNRFTSPGDTVLGIGVESTSLPEVALDRGRRLELFLADKGAVESIKERVDKAFLKASNCGCFHVEVGVEIFVGPSLLPSGIQADTTPEAVRTEGSQDLAKKRMVDTTQEFGYTVQFSDVGGTYELYPRRDRNTSPSYLDVPLWGKLIVYDSPKDAIESISNDDIDNQALRLVLVASHRQLQRMLEPGKEVCWPEAALYLADDPTCPLFWLTWDTHHQQDSMDIVSSVPQMGSRAASLGAVQGSSDGRMHALRAVVSKRRKTGTSRVEVKRLYVNPGSHVVGGPGFSSMFTSRRKDGVSRRHQNEDDSASGSSDDSDAASGAKWMEW